MKVSRDFLLNDLGIFDNPVEDNILDQDRWTTYFEIIFKWNDKFYRAYYRMGSTELQDEGPWEYEKEVEIEEVHKVEKVMKVWEPILKK